jgi:hypothetical protein
MELSANEKASLLPVPFDKLCDPEWLGSKPASDGEEPDSAEVDV